MIRDVTFERTEYDAPPRKYEAGTPNVEGAVGLAAALDYVERIGMAAIGEHEAALLDCATARVGEIDGLRVIGTARDKGAILSFVVDGFTAQEVGAVLDRHGVAVRSGHHCALPAMRRFGIEGTARASFALYNDREDVDQLIEALRAVRR
jgi:cysteine desulfurase/selenocysteine lyase